MLAAAALLACIFELIAVIVQKRLGGGENNFLGASVAHVFNISSVWIIGTLFPLFIQHISKEGGGRCARAVSLLPSTRHFPSALPGKLSRVFPHGQD